MSSSMSSSSSSSSSKSPKSQSCFTGDGIRLYYQNLLPEVVLRVYLLKRFLRIGVFHWALMIETENNRFIFQYGPEGVGTYKHTKDDSLAYVLKGVAGIGDYVLMQLIKTEHIQSIDSLITKAIQMAENDFTGKKYSIWHNSCQNFVIQFFSGVADDNAVLNMKMKMSIIKTIAFFAVPMYSLLTTITDFIEFDQNGVIVQKMVKVS